MGQARGEPARFAIATEGLAARAQGHRLRIEREGLGPPEDALPDYVQRDDKVSYSSMTSASAIGRGSKCAWSLCDQLTRNGLSATRSSSVQRSAAGIGPALKRLAASLLR